MNKADMTWLATTTKPGQICSSV